MPIQGALPVSFGTVFPYGAFALDEGPLVIGQVGR
jgi:hypothetical protein